VSVWHRAASLNLRLRSFAPFQFNGVARARG
jgi:hypothetical protein